MNRKRESFSSFRRSGSSIASLLHPGIAKRHSLQRSSSLRDNSSRLPIKIAKPADFCAHICQKKLRNKIHLAQEELIKNKEEVGLDSFAEPYRRKWRRLQISVRFIARLRLNLKRLRLFGAKPDHRRYHETARPKASTLLRHLVESRGLLLFHTAFSLLFLLLVSVFVPLGTGFELGKANQLVFSSFMFSVYGYFWLDLLMMLLSSSKEMKAQTQDSSNSNRASEYRTRQYFGSGYFWLDLLASIPFDFFMDAGLLRFNTLFKVPSLCHRVAQAFSTQGTGERLKSELMDPTKSRLFRGLKLVLIAAVLLHSAVCVWVGFSRSPRSNWLQK